MNDWLEMRTAFFKKVLVYIVNTCYPRASRIKERKFSVGHFSGYYSLSPLFLSSLSLLSLSSLFSLSSLSLLYPFSLSLSSLSLSSLSLTLEI